MDDQSDLLRGKELRGGGRDLPEVSRRRRSAAVPWVMMATQQ